MSHNCKGITSECQCTKCEIRGAGPGAQRVDAEGSAGGTGARCRVRTAVSSAQASWHAEKTSRTTEDSRDIWFTGTYCSFSMNNSFLFSVLRNSLGCFRFIVPLQRPIMQWNILNCFKVYIIIYIVAYRHNWYVYAETNAWYRSPTLDALHQRDEYKYHLSYKLYS